MSLNLKHGRWTVHVRNPKLPDSVTDRESRRKTLFITDATDPVSLGIFNVRPYLLGTTKFYSFLYVPEVAVYLANTLTTGHAAMDPVTS